MQKMIVMTYMNVLTKRDKNYKRKLLIILFLFSILLILTIYYYRNINFTIFSVDEITNSHMEEEAPKDGSLGIWYGDDNNSDNKGSYYICHDYGKIGRKVLISKIGDYFKIKGQKYQIYNIKKVKNTTYFYEISDLVMTDFESASIQVCIPFTDYNKIIIAKAINEN